MGASVARLAAAVLVWVVVLAGCAMGPVKGSGKRRASSSEVQLARAFGYPERQLEKGIKSGSVRPLAGCADPKNADFFSRFRTFEEIEAFLKDRICTLRQEIGSLGERCELVTIGTSVEGRPIYALELRNPSALEEARKKSGKSKKAFRERAVLMTGTLHAREWTATMTVLLTAMRVDVTDVSVFVVPVWNPDGYVHSWSGEKSTKKKWVKGEVVAEEVPARMWRKNRRLNEDGSVGVDLNRNFGSSGEIWGTDKKSKSINLTESDIFQGPAGWSEPETAAVRDYHRKYRKNIVSFVDVHCCIGAVLEPFSTSKKAPEYVFDVGQMMIDSINRKAPPDEKYEWRPRPASSASGSGISSSWAFQEAKIAFTYVVELRSKFVMPCSEIKPIGNEFLLGFRTLMLQLSRLDELLAEYASHHAARVGSADSVALVDEGDGGMLRSSVTVRSRGSRAPIYFLLGLVLLGMVYVAKAKSEPAKNN